MALITIVESKSKKTKCSCCGDIIPTCQKFSKIESTNYCHHSNCHTKYLPMNHQVEKEVYEDLEGRSERQRETFAAYRANGVSMEVYWSDRDSGYCD